MPIAPEQMWQDRPTPPLLLSLTGGGYRGYFTALILAKIEEVLRAPCHKVFDLIAGTSIGGILGLALASGVPARAIAETIKTKGSTIFPPLKFKGMRRIAGPPYRTTGIREAFSELLPEKVNSPVSESLQRVMVVTVSLATARLVVPRSWDVSGTGGMKLIDAALATSAAPTYFPAHRCAIGGGESAPMFDLVDGGISANAPDALALHYAAAELAFPADRSFILSIGTCGRAEGGIPGERPAAHGFVGALRNLGGRGVINLMMSVQEARGIDEASRYVGAERYLRIDETASAEQAKFLQLDNASPTTQKTLEALASKAADIGKLEAHAVWQQMVARAKRGT